jgi:hypothetical protein
MDVQHRKCNREHEDIPEAPQARCSAAGPPAPVATRRKTGDDHDFLATGNVFGAPRQQCHAASFCPVCPCSQSSPSIFFFFTLFHGFPPTISKDANVRNSHFLGDPGAKTVLGSRFMIHNKHLIATIGQRPVPLPPRGFSAQLKAKVGSTLAKVAVLRVNLNIDGESITSRTHTHPSHSQTSRQLTSSLSLGVPVPRATQCM